MPPSRSTPSTGRPAGHSADDLRAHYLAADYLVAGGEGFTLKVDHASSALLALHRRHAVSCSAFLTACNPRSQLRGDEQNRRAQCELESLLARQGYACVPGRAVDPAGLWPDEASVLALGVPASEAAKLAHHFGQNALLVMAADAVPQLLWVQSPDPT
jgi:hypothetical protein